MTFLEKQATRQLTAPLLNPQPQEELRGRQHSFMAENMGMGVAWCWV